jgi:four helix bundle protein
MNQILFSHEKLNVYSKSLDFVEWITVNVLNRIEKRISIHDQLDRASTSIALNIAEGNGKYTSKDRCRYFDIARGSALECAAALDVITAKSLLKDEDTREGKILLNEIVSMLIGLIRNNSDRVYEDLLSYETDQDREDDND